LNTDYHLTVYDNTVRKTYKTVLNKINNAKFHISYFPTFMLYYITTH